METINMMKLQYGVMNNRLIFPFRVTNNLFLYAEIYGNFNLSGKSIDNVFAIRWNYGNNEY